jgi:hypothetical protein
MSRTVCPALSGLHLSFLSHRFSFGIHDGPETLS